LTARMTVTSCQMSTGVQGPLAMAKSLGVFAGCGATLRAAELGRLDQPDEARSASSEVGCTPHCLGRGGLGDARFTRAALARRDVAR